MRVSDLIAGRQSTPPYVANFDSATTLLRATARFLHGEDFPRLGVIPASLTPALRALNRLPFSWRQHLFTMSGVSEAVSPHRLGEIRIDAIRQWVVDQYPHRGYPAVLIGSANGALVHLAALLGIPWLPQTFLIPVRRSLPAGAARADLEWGTRPGRELLAGNPDCQLHQMHDPNQDRLLIERMAYFRVKSLALGRAYTEFLETVLAPGGTIVLVECNQEWPTTRVADRHIFQFGGVGGLTPDEYFSGGDRVESFRNHDRVAPPEWDPPTPDGDRPEAEWGFDPSLRTDVRRVAAEQGYDVKRLSFERPSDPGSVVADVYRDHYADRGVAPHRLLVESFALVEPWWALRTGSVPYWVPFTTSADANALDDYLANAPVSYDELYVMLISHGLESAGIAPLERWQSIIDTAANRGGIIGVSPQKYPLDFETYSRYHTDIRRTIRDRHPLPDPLSLDRFEAFVEDSGNRYPVSWDTA